jgi:hypothetical protein
MKRIEAEKNELVLQNESGTYAIIPANKREEVKRLLSEGCYDCIDRIVESLPKASDYAEGGTVIDPPTKDWRTYSKEFDAIPYNLDKEINERFINRSNKSKLQDENKWIAETKENIKQRRINEKIKYIADKLIKNNPQGNMSRVDYLEQFGDEAEDIIKTVYPKFSPTLWQETARGLESLTEANLSSTINNIANNKNFTSSEKADMLLKYSDNPIMSKAFDNLSSLKVLDIPGKLIQSIYKEDYTGADALQGKQNNAGTVEEIVTDPLNVLGLSAVKNALIPTKGIVLKKGKELSRFKKKQNIKKILNPAAIGTNIGSTVNDASSVTENIKAADGLVIDPPSDPPAELNSQDLLDYIGELESLNKYDVRYGLIPVEGLYDMTINEVLEYQSTLKDSAIGKYQILKTTLNDLVVNSGVDPNLKFTPETQDMLGMTLLKRRGWNKYLKGKMSQEDFAYALAQEWASLPTKDNKTYYKNTKNKSLTGYEDFIAYLGSGRQQPQEQTQEQPQQQPNAKDEINEILSNEPLMTQLEAKFGDLDALDKLDFTNPVEAAQQIPEVSEADINRIKSNLISNGSATKESLKYLPLQALVRTLRSRNVDKYQGIANNPILLKMVHNSLKQM